MERVNESIKRAECTPSPLLSCPVIWANNLLCLGNRSPSVEATGCYLKLWSAELRILTHWWESRDARGNPQDQSVQNSRERCPSFLFYVWVISLVESKWCFWPVDHILIKNLTSPTWAVLTPAMVKNLRLFSNGQIWNSIQITMALACLISPHCQPGVMLSSDRIAFRACPCPQPLAGCWANA